MLSVSRFLFGILLLVAVGMGAQAARIDEQELHALLVERVDVRKWCTSIVVGISSPQGRRIVSYGTMSLQDPRRVDGTTVFEIASLTKVFTALVLADMVNRQRVKLDAPVSTCLPDGVKVPQHGGKQITFLDLATHSSGLPLRPNNLASQTALNKYAGYTRDTMLVPSSVLRSRLAAAYDGKLHPVPNETTGALDGAGGLYSTVDDVLNFVELFLGRGPQPLVAAAATMLEPRRPGDGPDTRMGLGWRVTTSNGMQTVWSSGRADGYRAFMGFDPAARVAVVALTNAATNVGVDDIGCHILDPRVAIARQHLPADVLERYVGRYKFDDGVVMTVAREEEHLVVQMTGQGPSAVFASAPREFFPKDIEAQFVFDESGDRPAQSLILNQDGHSYKAVRIAQESRP